MSFFTDIKRIVRSGITNFRRSAVVSIASVLVMTVTLFIIGVLIFAGALLSFMLGRIESKVDINIYFVPTAQEENILSLGTALEDLPEVAEVTYTSRQQAYDQFRERHADDALIQQSLDELNVNPLGAVLNIRATEPSQYDQVAEYLESEEALTATGTSRIIEKINYNDNKLVIDRLTGLLENVRKFGLIITLFFIVISIVIAFNTLRLGIFVSKEEIAIKRLVGAENRYIQGPFLVEGVLYGVIATIIALLAFYFLFHSIGSELILFFGGFDLFAYYLDNFWQMFALLAAIGIIIGIVSSMLAVRKYLKT
ncbi:MAG: cell division transport system permease protein [Planctomycetota bacterium]|jgi:cell division transport system permease protein